ncbi:uncharacterized protein LOC117222594 [Megalopta genalis]|uniref:uncharacterized protein LOC117222594 n=1 Tax=Megalopta genalis TaxID=115081 RepID=UPI003FD398A6
MLRIASIVGLLVLMFVTTVSAANRCLTMRDEVTPKQTIYLNKRVLHINFEVSRRVTQRLSSQIMKIFLQEVLGYGNVNVLESDDNFDLFETFTRLANATFVIMNDRSNKSDIEKQPLVNMETWFPSQIDPTPFYSDYEDIVKDLGSVGPRGQFGWFVPEALSRTGESWATFARPDTAARFNVDEETLSMIRNYTVDPYTKQYYCNESFCRQGMYVPEQCQGGQPCALLLTSRPDVTSFVRADIDEMKLFVRVVWVGPNLKHLTETLTSDYLKQDRKTMAPAGSRSLVFLHWAPSSIVSNEADFRAILFPRCKSPQSKEVSCGYKSSRLTKLVWRRLEFAAKSAYEAINAVNFEDDIYEKLIDRYNKQSGTMSEEDIACGWLRDNLDYALREWLPYKSHNTLYVGGIFPMNTAFYSGKSIYIASIMAKDAINVNRTVLANYNMSVMAKNGQCKSDVVLKSFVDFVITKEFDKMIGVLGPACSETVEPLVGVSKHYHKVVISYSAEGSTFNDRTKYPYFFRTIGENKQYKHVYLELFKKLKWKRVAALTEDGQKYTEYISYMEDILRTNGITFVSNFKFPRERESGGMTKYLQDLKEKKAKIIIADVNDQVARQVMCEASRLEMTAAQGYVWFLPVWLRPQWYDTDRYNDTGDTVPCTTLEMSKAINGYLGISHAAFGSNDAIMQENITVRAWRDQYEQKCKDSGQPPSNYAGYAYDAMWTYAYAMDKLLKENESYVFTLRNPQTVDRLTTIIGEMDFYGVSGRINFLGGPSRYSVINILQYIDNETRLVGNFYPNVSTEKQEIVGGRLELNDSAIVWLSHKVPDDGSEPPQRCVIAGFADFLNVSCGVAFVIVNIFGIGVLAMTVIIGFIIIKRKYDEKVKFHEMYMKSLGLDFTQGNTSDLDKWEIPRDRVLINRKLGEGAFGTVYGGEAFFPDNGWLAVAVKTLKVGSSTDEKLDFLSEVEVMKRFEHKNIIKLLGVCIKGEPVLTVMEFMLYGDLKTYLLGRRHLVNDQSYEDSDEISNKKLTAMALDVARALSYLAQLKYVHRDVASRNCLVNAQRMVKLGDFGMTRPMYEHDYYKFNRKGMLPVRWMAPESLGLGVFTPASDVWSYGVLLYEIITFGSFPFQGMSNNEVLVHVKAGNSLVVPKGVRLQLEYLIYSCWRTDHTKRPTAPEIVDFLATNPRILSPCLDVPIASVQIEHAGQIDLQLTENNRKFSLSWPHRQNSRSSTSASSPLEIPDPPLLDITCHDNKTPECLLGDVVGDIESSKPLLPNNDKSGPAISLQYFQRNEDEGPKYVNVQPGMANHTGANHSSSTVQIEDRNSKPTENRNSKLPENRNSRLTENRNSEDVSIL